MEYVGLAMRRATRGNKGTHDQKKAYRTPASGKRSGPKFVGKWSIAAGGTAPAATTAPSKAEQCKAAPQLGKHTRLLW